MSGEQLTAYLTGIGVFLGVLTRLYRSLTGDRFDRKVKESAAELSGYTQMIADLRKEITALRAAQVNEIDRLQRQHRTEMQDLRASHAADRQRWDEERDRADEERARDRERITALEAQVQALLDRQRSVRRSP